MDVVYMCPCITGTWELCLDFIQKGSTFHAWLSFHRKEEEVWGLVGVCVRGCGWISVSLSLSGIFHYQKGEEVLVQLLNKISSYPVSWPQYNGRVSRLLSWGQMFRILLQLRKKENVTVKASERNSLRLNYGVWESKHPFYCSTGCTGDRSSYCA